MLVKLQGRRGNAIKHGLSARVVLPDESDRLNQLIALLAPKCEDKEVWHAARRAAEAWLYCERVSSARSDTINVLIESITQSRGTKKCAGTEDDGGQATAHIAQASDRLVRYERRALKQLEAALESLQLLIAKR